MNEDYFAAISKAMPEIPPRGVWVDPRKWAGKAHPHNPDWVSRGTHWSPADGKFRGKKNPNYDPLKPYS